LAWRLDDVRPPKIPAHSQCAKRIHIDRPEYLKEKVTTPDLIRLKMLAVKFTVGDWWIGFWHYGGLKVHSSLLSVNSARPGWLPAADLFLGEVVNLEEQMLLNCYHEQVRGRVRDAYRLAEGELTGLRSPILVRCPGQGWVANGGLFQ
jgi:hypothetical protein